MLLRLVGAVALSFAALAAHGACAPHNAQARWREPEVLVADGTRIAFDNLVERLASVRVVLIGEQHDDAAHHMNQLEVICRLRSQGRPLAIAMEFFQQPSQRALDRYVNDHGDVDRLLLESEYFSRWGFDFRLYAPIVEFARRHRIPLVALNPPTATVRRVSAAGTAGLEGESRARLENALAGASPGYRSRIRQAFLEHPGHEQRSFEHFLAVQLLWDETMAARVAGFLAAHPRHRLVVLAGGGHADFADAVGGRIERLTGDAPALLVQTRRNVDGDPLKAFVLRSPARALPPPGRLGITLQDSGDVVSVDGFSADSVARDAGIEKGDRLMRIDDTAITGLDRLRVAMWRKRPGDLVDLTIERAGERRTLRLALR